ncbi:hypothetical protein BJ741DRAFT_222712 [Chytriomyces cf. hyalinus JEL632]|nr:hypothetical protein BJ741DRAFT_222712 [Chytriomyces cf. hyalinus JEL632]
MITPCSSPGCPGCQRHAVHIHELHDAFESSTDAAIDETTSCLGSITRSAAFETMPPEILDRIVQYVDDESILPLCHALPYFKYISTAMFDFAQRFPYEVYSRIISKHGGNVHVYCGKEVLNYLGVLPDVLSVHPGGKNDSTTAWTKFLRGLADAKKRIRCCIMDIVSANGNLDEIARQLTRLQIQYLVWDTEDDLTEEIQEALPHISGLSYLGVHLPTDIGENILSRCLNLTEVAFARLLELEHSADPVACILRLIKGSRIHKVWCKTLSQHGFMYGLELLETISTDFLKHGWHKEIHEDEDRVCFVHRHA